MSNDSKYNLANKYASTYSDDELLISFSKEDIILVKNNKISELEKVIDELIKENEFIKESYAQSTSFFKHYIDLMEEELKKLSKSPSSNMFLTDLKDIKDNITFEVKDITVYGNFEKCPFCDEINLVKSINAHKDGLIELKVVENKIKFNDIEGLIKSVNHGFDIRLSIDKNNNSK